MVRWVSLGHAREPGQHVPGEPRPGRQVPGVDQDGRVLFGAVGEKLDQRAVVEVVIAEVVADVDAAEALSHGVADHRTGGFGVLEGHLAERGQPVRGVRGVSQQMRVDRPAPLDGALGFEVVAEQHGGTGQHLDVHAEPVQVGDTLRRVPQGAAHRPVLGGTGHHHAGARSVRGAQPGAVVGAGEQSGFGAPDLREDVGVHVDDGHAPASSSRRVRGRSRSGQSRPGCTAAQWGQVRAAVSA